MNSLMYKKNYHLVNYTFGCILLILDGGKIIASFTGMAKKGLGPTYLWKTFGREICYSENDISSKNSLLCRETV